MVSGTMTTPEDGLRMIFEAFTECNRAMTEMYRGRVLTYGPDAAKMLLHLFDTISSVMESPNVTVDPPDRSDP